jgi:hypothetical protein
MVKIEDKKSRNRLVKKKSTNNFLIKTMVSLPIKKY